MRIRRVAILIDGGFFLKRIQDLLKPHQFNNPQTVAGLTKLISRNHILTLTQCDKRQWLGHVYRIFFYDAIPFEGFSHHPFQNKQIDFSKTKVSIFRKDLFKELKKQRKTALRLGKVIKANDWSPPNKQIKKLLKTRDWIKKLSITNEDASPYIALNAEQVKDLKNLQRIWSEISDDGVALGFKQKGVDMRMGLDIASITLKKLADTIVLVSGDSDFVPAAKLARREGMELILDPLWQSVNDDLFEHIDGLQSGLKRPKTYNEAYS